MLPSRITLTKTHQNDIWRNHTEQNNNQNNDTQENDAHQNGIQQTTFSRANDIQLTFVKALSRTILGTITLN
jgi:hypothetical protein